MKKYILYTIVCFVFCFCTSQKQEFDITRKNINNKVNQAYHLTQEDNYEKLIPVLFFIDKNKIQFKDNCLQAKVNYLRAAKAYSILSTKEQKEFSKQAIEKAKYCGNNKLISLSYNLLSIAYYRENNLEKLKENVLKAIEFGEKEDNYVFLVDAYYNLIQYYIKFQDWGKVREFSQKGINAIKTFNEKKKRLKFFTIFCAKSHIEESDFNLAVTDLEEVIAIAEEIKPEDKTEFAKTYRDVYRTYSQLNRKKENYKKANEYLLLVDSLSVLIDKDLNSEVKDLLLNETNLNKKLIEVNKKIINSQRVFIGIGIVFTIFILWCLFKIKNYSDKLKRILKKEEQLNNELILKNDDLAEKNKRIERLLHQNDKLLLSRTLKMSKLKDAIQNVSKSIEKLVEDNEKVNSSELLFLNRNLNDVISETELWEEFKTEFEKSNPEFFIKLLEKAPNLTITEQKHFAYMSLNMSAKEVASLINISPRSVETARYRIKKKLDIIDNTLSEFLQEI